jgi:hypothetical protein
MKVHRILAFATSISCLTAVAVAGPAAADASASNRTDNSPARATLSTTSKTDGSPAPMALPSSCVGRSDVYKTGTDGGRANGRGTIDCLAYYRNLYAYTSLYRDRWWGNEFLDSDSSSANNARHVASISIWRCAGEGTYTYRSFGYHEATDIGGTRYTASTQNSNRFGC